MTHHKHDPGEWSKLSPWWQEAWTLWLSRGWQPRPKLASTSMLQALPVWNNSLLSASTNNYVSLHRSTNGNDTKLRYSVYRALGFLAFDDFLRPDNLSMTSQELKMAIERRPKRHPMAIDVVTIRSCTANMRRIMDMWNTAKHKFWNYDSTSVNQPPDAQWIWTKPQCHDLLTAQNRAIRETVRKKMTIIHVSNSIGANMNQVFAQ